MKHAFQFFKITAGGSKKYNLRTIFIKQKIEYPEKYGMVISQIKYFCNDRYTQEFISIQIC